MTDSLLDIWGMRKRGKRDSTRHAKRVKKAIKENLKDLISDVSIISSDGKKKTKIPLRFLDNYRFKHAGDKNQEGVGQGNKDGKPGDIIGHDGTGEKQPGQGDQAGDQAGEDVYEEEVEIAEIVNMMLEDLGLPWLESKDSVVEMETENIVFTDISEVGPLSNVDMKQTIFRNMKRNAKLNKEGIKNFIPDDLRYRIWDIEKEYHSNAAVYFLMDRSGSMDDNKKYIAKSFFFWLAHFCRTKYTNVELIFIAHTTTAKIEDEENFFKISNAGGTKCSSAFDLAYEHIEENHPPEIWNNYVFAFSDGDNWTEDNKKCMKTVEKLLDVCAAVGYGEINVDSMFYGGRFFGWSTLHDEFEKHIDHPKFMTACLEKKEDVYECLQKFLGIKSGD
jgi:sporulation protein YhbH